MVLRLGATTLAAQRGNGNLADCTPEGRAVADLNQLAAQHQDRTAGANGEAVRNAKAVAR